MGEVRQIPDDDPDGRLTMGMALFLASWTMMFGGLMIAYAILRSDAEVWPPPDAPRFPALLPGIATVVLILSSAALEHGVRGLRSARLAALRRGLVASLVLGGCFLVLQSIVWAQLWDAGVRTAGTYGGTFYVITWFHAAHVAVGLGLLVWLLAGARRGRFSARGLAPVRLTAMFWHFLLVSWLLIYAGLYLS